ncbi:MAG TPA: DUF3482 domain-containing protein, partial [Usitatibacter sp.]|nr:DUF3482 domain-containing protein [Usitatibacter sp.]
MTPERTVNLSLVSHTNVGKTTLVRTLLRRDIGEVADRPHVTEIAEAHELIGTEAGDVLRLWDTPGFGDSARLLARLEASGNPIAWLHTQVWDRFADRPFFSSQQAVRNVRDAGDVVLYLVNAAEDPGAAAYVPAEMRILGWIGKPVVVLLNQTGPGRGRERDALDESAWSAHLASHVGEHRVVTLDAFARCWVQEDVLLANVEQVIAKDKREPFRRLRAAWRARNLAVFDEAMRVLAAQLAALATDRQAIAESAGGIANVAQETRRLIASIAGKPPKEDPASERAMADLASRLDRTVRESTDRLIALHGLSGRATERILSRLAAQFDVSRTASVNASGVLGGVVSGALGGLAADLSAGGLTLGAGMLLGGVLGALGAGGAAQAYNLVRGADAGRVRWSAPFLAQRPAAALLRYLAVAHYGRGRGDWVESECPPHWRTVVDSVVEKRRGRFDEAWALASEGMAAPELQSRLQPLMAECARTALCALYP